MVILTTASTASFVISGLPHPHTRPLEPSNKSFRKKSLQYSTYIPASFHQTRLYGLYGWKLANNPCFLSPLQLVSDSGGTSSSNWSAQPWNYRGSVVSFNNLSYDVQISTGCCKSESKPILRGVRSVLQIEEARLTLGLRVFRSRNHHTFSTNARISEKSRLEQERCIPNILDPSKYGTNANLFSMYRSRI